MKYECPKCKSQLKYWEEFGFAKERLINKQTGELNKRIRTSNEYELGTHGLTCTNRSCRFKYYGNFTANEKVYDYLDIVLERTL
jgi:transcription initiation factor IIE alpha subunit